MALSNAERQKRHRERVKAKLEAAVDPGHSAVEREPATDGPADLLQEYRAVARVWPRVVGRAKDDEAVVDAFLSEKVAYNDIVKIVRQAAFVRLNQLFRTTMHGGPVRFDEPDWIRHETELKKLRVT